MIKKQRKHKRATTNNERNLQLTDFSGLREMIIAHHSSLHAKLLSFKTKEEDQQMAMSTFLVS